MGLLAASVLDINGDLVGLVGWLNVGLFLVSEKDLWVERSGMGCWMFRSN